MQPSVRILIGDVRARLAELPSESVHCVVTSPPYFGLRDYGVADQIGLEATPDAYVAELVAVFRECRRVLRQDGTLWLNLGDSYCSTAPGTMGAPLRQSGIFAGVKDETAKARAKFRPDTPPGMKPKDRMMIPARVALALQSDGWWLRDEIIWHKPNPMPASVTDRTTPAHEMLYMLTKSARYFYDMKAVKESATRGAAGSKFTEGKTAISQVRASDSERAEDGKRQPRSVWTITPKPFKGAHFATFPPDLAERCIRAGCPVGGTVLDPFSGAGTTALVAKGLGRNAIGVELNPAYALMSATRISEAA